MNQDRHYSTEAITSTQLGLALDAATLRQQVIATNIANVNTEAYAPMRLSFASQMEQLEVVSKNMQGRGGSTNAFLPPLRLETLTDANGMPAKVELDGEVAAMAHNSIQYQALVRGLMRHYSILNTAVNDGKK
jgi:flagellar basal-body rod protein FlgB